MFGRECSNSVRRAILAFSVFMVGTVAAYAVSPLVVDDADTTEPGHIQVNPDFAFVRQGTVWLYSIPINPVVGINARAELGIIFGYQWRDGSGSTPIILGITRSMSQAPISAMITGLQAAP